MRQRLHIGWLLAISCWLLAVSCSSDETGEKQPTTLTVYVYSPAHPMLIRGAVGPVDASIAETEITKLQIWIFESGTGKKIGYLETKETALLNTSEGATFQMIVDDDFAKYKPDVDVYVLANLTRYENCDCILNEESTRDYLKDNANLNDTDTSDKSYFGWNPLFTSVPNGGLPMVGVLKNQPVIGEAPVLRIGTESHIANVMLERAVSKMRFVFAKTQGDAALKIQNIQLNTGMIPTEEYLIPQTKTLNYNTEPISFLSGEVEVTAAVPNPTVYIYDGQESQTYENLIDNAGLTTVGPFYLRESDRQLQGMINYTLGGNENTADFQMDEAGDFSRNHTWIIYAYHAGGGFLQMNTLYIKDWTTKTEEHEVYNW